VLIYKRQQVHTTFVCLAGFFSSSSSEEDSSDEDDSSSLLPLLLLLLALGLLLRFGLVDFFSFSPFSRFFFSCAWSLNRLRSSPSGWLSLTSGRADPATPHVKTNSV